jgi:hypothetical protein
VPDPAVSRTRRARVPSSAPWPTWASTPGTPLDGHPVDRVFIGSLHQRPHRGPARGRRGRRRAARSPPGVQRAGGAGLGPGQGAGRGRGAGHASSARPASNGASPAAPCAWP